MKILAWAAGVLFAVWLTAFFSIKVYDLGCVTSPSICFTETGVWLRKLVLLEWTSKWQTLISGLCALLAGALLVYATNLQLKEARNIRIATDNQRIVANFYQLFQELLEISHSRSDQPPKIIERINRAKDSIRQSTIAFPQFSTELHILLTHIVLQNGRMGNFDVAKIDAYSVIASAVAQIASTHTKPLLSMVASDVRLSRKYIDDVARRYALNPSDLDHFHQYCASTST